MMAKKVGQNIPTTCEVPRWIRYKAMLHNMDYEEFMATSSVDPDGVLIDVRTPEEIQEGYLEGATFLDYMSEDFKGSLEKLDRERIYGVYCQSGIRSNNTLQMMQSMGFQQVYDMDGGYLRYLEQKDD